MHFKVTTAIEEPWTIADNSTGQVMKMKMVNQMTIVNMLLMIEYNDDDDEYGTRYDNDDGSSTNFYHQLVCCDDDDIVFDNGGEVCDRGSRLIVVEVY